MKRLYFFIAISLLLCIAGNASAQHLLHRDIVAEANALGLTQQKADKLMAGYHPLLFGGHKNSKNGAKTQTFSPRKAKPNANLAEGVADIRMYGYLPYANDWTEDNYGLYTFNTVPPVNFTKLADGPDGPVGADGGGCYYDGKYYAVTYAGFMGLVLAEFCVYDTVTWQMEKYLPVAGGTVSSDMDFDPTTGYIYGAFYNDNFDGFVFGYVNPENGERTAICDLNRIFFGVSVNSKGEVYGLDEQGMLSKFDKKTGERTVIGSTGLTPVYLSSATFDQKTDKLYWNVFNDEGSCLYNINTETAEATLLCQFPHDEEVQGMFIPVPAAEKGAPAKAEALSAKFVGAALTGKIAFTMPTKKYGGDALTGNVDYELYVNDVYYASGVAAAGASVEAEITVPTYGRYKLSVRPKNEEGLAPVASVSLWIGKDVPAAVTDITVADGAAEGDVVLTWSAPTQPMHGGYLALDELEYMVQRFKAPGDSVTVATTKELTINDHIVEEGTIRPYYYKITPIVDGDREGEAAYSRKIGMGKPLSTPYVQNFNDGNSFDLFTIVDRHNDAKTWEYDPTFQAARAQYDWTNPKNDWLITPPIHLTADRVYKISFDVWCRGENMERFEVKYGKGKTHTAMKETLVPRTEIRNDEPENYFRLLQIAEDGDYNFGFHAVSDVDMWWLYLDNISITNGPKLGTPNEVTDLSVKAAEKGELKATLSFTLPTTTVDGLELTSIKNIAIYRNSAMVENITSVTPGQQMTYEDVKAKQGMNTYRIRIFGDKGEGLEATASTYVGVDVPTAPTNVVLKKVDGNAVLTWDAPTTGVNNGYVDPEAVAYYVIRSDNAEIAERIYDETVTDESVKEIEGQAFLSYAVFAQNAAGVNPDLYALSNEVCFGTPYELPFHESFAGVDMQMGPWTFDIDEGDAWIKIDEAGVYPQTTAQDNDGGLVAFQPENKGEVATLYSSNISLVDAKKPKFRFWYYNEPGSFNKISARVRLDDDPNMVDEVFYVNMGATSGVAGWTEAVCDLAKYVGHNIQLVFNFISGSDTYIYIDNISVSGLRSDLPYITDLTAEYNDGMVELSWTEPTDEQGLGFIGYNVYRNGTLLTEEPIIDPMFEDNVGSLNNSYVYQVTVVYEEGETIYSNAVNVSADGISEVLTDNRKDAKIYTISGQRLSKAPLRGMYILGNSKYVK